MKAEPSCYISLKSQGLAHAGPYPGAYVNLGQAEVIEVTASW